MHSLTLALDGGEWSASQGVKLFPYRIPILQSIGDGNKGSRVVHFCIFLLRKLPS
jgi:hypothetical protein